MESKSISLAYSPCPNDTFIFYNLIHKNILNGYNIREELHDVEHLNRAAEMKSYDATKLSFFAFFHFMDRYKLIDSGSALGSGCGPLLVKKKGKKIGNLNGKEILVPGLLTTANLLTHIFLSSGFTPVPLRYDKIMDKILKEEYDAGVIIHEERFTYEKKGLEKIIDLGDFWEGTYHKPIPLGGISVRRDLDESIALEFEKAIRKSLEMAYENPSEARDYIRDNAQEKDENVIQSHIDLYVNSYSLSLGEKGREAIFFLLDKAMSTGLIRGGSTENLFLNF